MFQNRKIEIEKLKEKANKFAKFKKSSLSLKNLLNSQKSFGDKMGLGFNSCEASTSETKQIKFVKSPGI